MTNKEKYRQAFAALPISDDFTLEVNRMKTNAKKRRFTAMAASIAACILLTASATTAYAADIGGIQRKIQLWIHGDQTDAALEFDGKGSYSLEYTDSQGNLQHRGGGGIAFAPDGSEIPLSEEELMEQLTMPEVAYEEDGSVWVYWFDQQIDITDKFENGVCYVKLVNEEETLYMTIQYENGYATSPHRYVDPSSFN